jgi:SOS-response transcriptional repressor LexA
MKHPITDRQRAVLAFCAEFFDSNDQLPGYRLIAEHFGWASHNAAVEMMFALRRKGYVERNLMDRWKFTEKARALIADRERMAQC